MSLIRTSVPRDGSMLLLLRSWEGFLTVRALVVTLAPSPLSDSQRLFPKGGGNPIKSLWDPVQMTGAGSRIWTFYFSSPHILYFIEQWSHIKHHLACVGAGTYWTWADNFPVNFFHVWAQTLGQLTQCLSVIHCHSPLVVLYGALRKPNYSVYMGYQREGRITATQLYIMSGKTAWHVWTSNLDVDIF